MRNENPAGLVEEQVIHSGDETANSTDEDSEGDFDDASFLEDMNSAAAMHKRREYARDLIIATNAASDYTAESEAGKAAHAAAYAFESEAAAGAKDVSSYALAMRNRIRGVLEKVATTSPPPAAPAAAAQQQQQQHQLLQRQQQQQQQQWQQHQHHHHHHHQHHHRQQHQKQQQLQQQRQQQQE